MKNGELISELFRLPVRDIEEIAPGTALILLRTQMMKVWDVAALLLKLWPEATRQWW